MEIITGRTGEPHVYAADDAEIYRLFLGDGDFLLVTGNQLEARMNGTNEVRIYDGSLMMQGRLAKIRPSDGFDSLSLDIGTVNYKRADLVVAEYNQIVVEREEEHEGQVVTITDKFDSVTLKIIKGTPDATQYIEPEITTGNIDLGETHQTKLWAVYLDGINFDRLVDYRNILNTNPIQTALDTATNSVAQITSMMSALQDDIYTYADSLREGIAGAITGRWTAVAEVQSPVSNRTFKLGIYGYEYSPSHVVNVYLNGLRLNDSDYKKEYTVIDPEESGYVKIQLAEGFEGFTGLMYIEIFSINEEA